MSLWDHNKRLLTCPGRGHRGACGGRAGPVGGVKALVGHGVIRQEDEGHGGP